MNKTQIFWDVGILHYPIFDVRRYVNKSERSSKDQTSYTDLHSYLILRLDVDSRF